ncbi:MAG: UDP-N-acetylglucosamine 2-epimerase (hydrolyzing) [Flavobacteriaceae bacterium]|nr:UDP-N-acetylglucosamine 2-epimerase (hydrolyzing) [Flavobacteriaceae bacterium]|tara:strand:- start:4431 stop:5594 length:1164 start_codon:yes stop_codon:yes gene_type:complete
MKKRRICIVTGTRAEYGLLSFLMKEIHHHKNLDLKILATGMHLSPEFGLTFNEIEKDGFKINKKIEVLTSSDTPIGISKSIGLGMISFSEALSDIKPDMLVVLGDRFEILPAVISAAIQRIPIAHIHGGESTEGLIDEPIRHAITKFSHLHFAATNEYKNRIIQMGENKKNVYCTGGMGIDFIKQNKFLSKDQLEKQLNLKFNVRNFLVAFHPVTLEKRSSKKQFLNILNALSKLESTNIIFTKANADTDGRIINELIDNYVSKNPNCISFTSMGQQNFLSSMRQVDAIIGNSSSGLLEAPSFKIGTINIGDRQRGRIKAKSVIDCSDQSEDILKAITKLYSKEFQEKLQKVKNPYDNGIPSKKIVKILDSVSLDNIIKKKFISLDL